MIQLPLVIASAGHRPFRIGAVIACQNGGIVLAPLWGWLAERLRALKATFIGSFALIGVSFASFAFGQSLADLLVSGFLLGLGTGACNTMVILLVTNSAPRHSWSARIATLQMLGAIGSVLGLGLAAVISSRAGMITAFLLSILAITVASCAPSAKLPSGWVAPVLLTASEKPSRAKFVAFLVTWFSFSLAVSEFSSFYPITMGHDFGVSVSRSAGMLSFATLASLPLYCIVGRVAQRLGSIGLFTLGVSGRAVCVIVLATLPTGHSVLSVVALGCAGVFQIMWPLIGTASSELAVRLAPAQGGVAVGLFQAIGSVASAIGALLSGFVADRYGYGDVLGVASAVAIFSAILSLVLFRSVWAYEQNAGSAGGKEEPPREIS